MIPADPVAAHLNAHYRPDVAANLLAAAQPLMALAWDECVESDTPWINPYRSNA